MHKICINGIIREMTTEELKEQSEVDVIQDEKPTQSMEERIKNLEKFFEKLGFSK